MRWGTSTDRVETVATGGSPTTTWAGRSSLAMHQDGLVPQPLFVMGDPDGCSVILSSVLRPRDAYLLGNEVLDEAVGEHYELERPVFLHRMAVDRSTFQPFAGPAERLMAADIEALNRLYQLGFRGGFPGSVLDEGVYYGVWVRASW